jgi:hypothetical protein
MASPLQIPTDLDATVEQYKRLRPILKQLHTEISRLVRKDDIFACAKRLRMLGKQNGKKVIHFEHEFEMDIFTDYQIYMHRPNGINAAQQMQNRNRYPAGSDERRLLDGMVEARFSVFMVKEIVRDAGFIGFDLYTGEEFFIMDLTLPKQDVAGLMIGFRIFPFGGYWMHTGANLTLGKMRDTQSIKPLGALTSVKEEQNLNDEVIFEWRQMVSEMDE